MATPYTQNQVNAAVQRLQPVATVQAPQVSVPDVPSQSDLLARGAATAINAQPVARRGFVTSANAAPMYREARIANPNYNMPGSAEAHSQWGIPPVVVQSDPYSTLAFAAGPDGSVAPLIGYPSRVPHVMNGVPRPYGGGSLGSLLNGLMAYGRHPAATAPIVMQQRRTSSPASPAGPGKPAGPAKPDAPAQSQPLSPIDNTPKPTNWLQRDDFVDTFLFPSGQDALYKEQPLWAIDPSAHTLPLQRELVRPATNPDMGGPDGPNFAAPDLYKESPDVVSPEILALGVEALARSTDPADQIRLRQLMAETSPELITQDELGSADRIYMGNTTMQNRAANEFNNFVRRGGGPASTVSPEYMAELQRQMGLTY